MTSEKRKSISTSWVHRLSSGQFLGVMHIGECPELSFGDQKQEKEPMFHQTRTPWERTFLKRDGEIGKHKLNKIGALNVKQKNWKNLGKSKRSSYSPFVFKHGCSIETYLELWRKKAIPEHLYSSRKNQDNSYMHLDFKKWLQVFLLVPSFWWYRVLLFFCWPIMIKWY